MFLAAYDSDGVLLDVFQFGSDDTDFFGDLAVYGTGSVHLCGATYGLLPGVADDPAFGRDDGFAARADGLPEPGTLGMLLALLLVGGPLPRRRFGRSS